MSQNDLRGMIGMDQFDWAELGRTDLLKPGHQLGEPHLLFEKIEDDAIQRQLDKLAATKKANEAAEAAKDYKAEPVKPDIPFDQWEKLDIRVGHIKDCQAVRKSNKLLQFTIDDGAAPTAPFSPASRSSTSPSSSWARTCCSSPTSRPAR